jgi:Cdc6-like AAA superfamily ATPase
MAKSGSALKVASDGLYDAWALVNDAVLGAGLELQEDSRASFMRAARKIAVHVATGDERLSVAENSAIANIFWLEEGFDNWSLRNQMLHDPSMIESALSLVGAYAEASNIAPNGSARVVVAITTMLHTVVAIEGAEEPEVNRLNEVTARLRKLIPPPAAVSPPVESGPCEEMPDGASTILASLDQLVGLDEVKREVETLVNLAKVFSIRKKMGLKVPDMSFHLVFLGNPGTGKTTVARIIAQLYGKLSLLSKGHLVEVDRAGLVANYIGQTATKVQEVVTSAMGGVLFIDEAYALHDESEMDFGQEAVSTLLKAMEDHRSNLVVIAAGYTNEMQRFLDMNPGLRSRMPRHLAFADYSPPEMATILQRMAEGAGYSLPSNCESELLGIFQRRWEGRGKDFANARDVRNVFEAMIEQHANRVGLLAEPTGVDLTALVIEDIAAIANEAPQARAA